MATKPLNARARTWATAFNKYVSLNQRLIQAPAKDRDGLERAIVAQEEELLDTPAPSFGAVITKLELLWEQQLDGTDTEAKARRLVLEDLADLIAKNRLLLGEAA